MDFTYSDAEEAFRRELSGWLAVNLAEHRRIWPPSDDEPSLHPDKAFDSSLAWHKRMHHGGWVGIHWPRERLLGRLHGGWEVAISVLMYERMALGSMAILHHDIDRVLALARAPEDGRWAFQALFALRFGIAGGTTEIQKSIIGERLLGLPK